MYLNNKVNDYFYSPNINNKPRMEIYDKFAVVDAEGMIVGTKLSSLKGKNIALCSEKSITIYIILENLYRRNIISRKPTMVLSTLRTENTPNEPHAFVLIDLGLYTLSPEQYDNIINGFECTPISLFEVMRQDLHDIGDKRIYGSITLNKLI